MTLRWGILGTGFVAKKFALGLKATPGSKVVAVGSRTLDRAREFAGPLAISKPFGSYEGLVACPEVDIVYVATPPSRHHEDAHLCIAAGKHVLIEKPFALDAGQARAIIDAARTRGVFCMEAMWTRFLPAIRWAKAQITEGRLGEVQMMTGSFGVCESFPPGHWMLDATQGGGALLDRGIYPLSLARHFAGSSPIDVSSQVVLGPTGVDEQASVLLRFGRATLANLHTTLRATTVNEFHIYGSKGSIILREPIYRPYRLDVHSVHPRSPVPPVASTSWKDRIRESGFAHLAMQRAQGVRDLSHVVGPRTIPYAGNGYGHQVEEVERCLAAGRLESRVMPHEQTVELIAIIDRIRANAAPTLKVER